MSDTQLTCISCKLLFNDADQHREHYASQLHRVNLKRKLADLPPLSGDDFERRREAAAAAERKDENVYECAPCRKVYQSMKQYESHCESKKHKQRLASLPSDDERRGPLVRSSDSSAMSGAATPQSEQSDALQPPDGLGEEELLEWKIKHGRRLAANQCFFCLKRCKSTEQCVEHMSVEHNFFIPDIDYLVDLSGFLSYMSQRIAIGNLCVHCDKGFNSMEAVQSHMIDTNHCRFPLEGEDDDEYFEFWDYAQHGDEVAEADDGSDSGSGGGADHEAANGDAMETDENENGATAVDRKRRRKVQPSIVRVSDMRIYFASGKSVGHRALRQYYRQHLSAGDQRESARVRQIVRDRYKALGHHTELSSAQRQVLVAKQRTYVKRRRRHDLKTDVRGNKLFVIRPQVMF